MGKGKALVNKMKRRNRYLNRNRGLRRQDKIDKRDEFLSDSPKAFKLVRGIERRLDNKFGMEMIPSPDSVLLEKLIIVSDLDRFDFDPGAGTDNALRLRMDVEQAGEMEETEIECLADTGAFEEAEFTMPSGAAAVQADYLYFTDPSGETWAVWLDIDAADTAPTGANYAGADNQVEVDILSSDTNVQVAGKVFAALDGNITDMSLVDNADGTLTLTSDLLGDLADADTFDEDDSGAGTISVIVSQGADSNLQNTSLRISSPTENYIVWFNVNEEGAEPTVPEAVTYIEVALGGGESDADVATALSAALDAEDDFESSSALEVATVTNSADGSAADAEDIDTGFTISVVQQGSNELNRMSFKALGVKEGDVVQILNGDLMGKEYSVVEMIDDNTLRLEDDAALSGAEEDVPCKIRLSSIKKSYY